MFCRDCCGAGPHIRAAPLHAKEKGARSCVSRNEGQLADLVTHGHRYRHQSHTKRGDQENDRFWRVWQLCHDSITGLQSQSLQACDERTTFAHGICQD
jgi:predicted lipoprotein with Yx(FWY)xxD motif